MRRVRAVLATVVLGTAVASGAGAGVDAAPSGPCGSHVSRLSQTWLGLDPGFSTGPSSIQQLAVTAFVPDQMYVTNGKVVSRTADGGCTWQEIAKVTGQGAGVVPQPVGGVLQLPSTATIADIEAPSSATLTGAVYVAWNDTSSLGGAVTLTKPHIWYHDDQGWHDGAGLPDYGTVVDVAASDYLPQDGYAIIDPSTSPAAAASGGGLYRTGDGGKNWSQINSSVTSSGYSALRADPVAPSNVYALGGNGLLVSRDAGVTFTSGGKPGADVTSYDVQVGNGAVRLAQGHRSSASYDRSDDFGASWVSYPAHVTAKYVALQPLFDVTAVGDGHRVWIQPQHTSFVRPTEATPPGGMPGPVQFTAPVGDSYAIAGVRGGLVLRGTFHLSGQPILTQGLTPIRLLPQVLPHQFPSSLLPQTTALRLPAGAHRDVSYQLVLPRTPSPIDVMFLVDTTDSMQEAINGLRQDLQTIVNDLSGLGLAVQFGVADFRDYDPSVGNRGDGDIGDYAYRLDRRIGLADESLRRALAKLKSNGGGDPPEADLTALYQSTTGDGQRLPGGRGFIRYLHPGDGAGYRPQSLKLAVLATDNAFHRERNYLTPTWEATVAALNSHGVHPVGLAVETTDSNGVSSGFRSFRDETDLAKATNTFAPRGGVDCNGDVQPDVAQGAPFVCKLPSRTQPGTGGGVVPGVPGSQPTEQPTRLAPAIVSAAEAIPDLRGVALGIRGQASIARVVAPASSPVVNVKTDNTLTYTVRYTCPSLSKVQHYRLGLDAGLAGRVVASTHMSVLCGPVAAKPKPKPVLGVVPPVLPNTQPEAAAPPPPPAPANPPPNPNPNPNPALNPNVGFASQEEEQRQLAFAGADEAVTENRSEEMAMSRLFLGGAAMLLAGATAYAARRRFSAAWHRN